MGAAKKQEDGEVEAVSGAYLRRSKGNAVRALREAIADGLDGVAACEQRSHEKDRAISRGYVRAGAPEKA